MSHKQLFITKVNELIKSAYICIDEEIINSIPWKVMTAICWPLISLLMRHIWVATRTMVFCSLFSLSFAIDAQTWIVSNPSHQTEVTPKSIRSIFSLRQKNWSNGRAIQVVVMENNSELHKDFCLDALKLFPYQLSRIWERQIYTGTAIAPIVVSTEHDMLNMIKLNPNAIGYASQEVENEELHSFNLD
ncbi:hypothetical protein [Agarivorans sp. Z349TD_8]|uniref:hypothetical protein n=1 Tax=Agarivorans sp. Z349TD_8 TaxID=3421434 RepID=UPI003D7CCEBE